QDLDRLWPLEIEHETALVAVERDKAHALVVADRRRRTTHVALRRFDLDHVGAHVGEQRAGKRACDEIRELDDPNSRQRFWHVVSLVRFSLSLIGRHSGARAQRGSRNPYFRTVVMDSDPE